MLGFVNIYKPAGETSSRTVQFVKWTLVKAFGLSKKLKVGHFGTLDPEASGVLPIAIGNACRLFEYSLDKIKVYKAEILFGKSTSTLDVFGEVLEEVQCDVSEEQLKKAILDFPKTYDQIPPNVSAKSIGGVKAYKLARQGVEFSLPSKTVTIHELSYVKKLDDNKYEISLTCSAGTYVRSICRDLGDILGVPACMGKLLRLKSGEFDIENAVTKEEFEKNPLNYLLDCDVVVEKLPRLDVSYDVLIKLKNGLQQYTDATNGTYRIYEDEKLVGITKVENGVNKFVTRLI